MWDSKDPDTNPLNMYDDDWADKILGDYFTISGSKNDNEEITSFF